MAAENPLVFSSAEAQRLEPHLPPLSYFSSSSSSSPPSPSPSPSPTSSNNKLPFVTLTFATSLDSALSLGPGIRTALSGPQSKAMTHYLRSRHDAICVGVGTAIADNPGLNCRLAAADASRPVSSHTTDTAGVGALLGLASLSTENAATRRRAGGNVFSAHQPRPIVIDPRLRWDFTPDSKVLQLARAGQGLAPYVITAVSQPPEGKKKLLEGLGGKFIVLNPNPHPHPPPPPPPPQPAKATTAAAARATPRFPQRFDWHDVLAAVRNEGLRSIMVEGGGEVINSLLSHENARLIHSVIVTIAPTWLGQGSVFVSPPRRAGLDGKPSAVARLADTTWVPLGEDVVLCGRLAA
ncbi:putative riboflavin biosynthesis protein Rib7 [Hypoxylon fragiforme]|uniref:putative riboflavin biosynthesis protein Rib7 n=1 Tax=Hypoxylon fragiforme TaxID=63214 RepID=UPI0020C68DB1|nr:putative riboflavin biosynthesis protein Rib7 [Hypoxylon fragiforme]KAI2607582.1 putative riboflavin biosynthesis protein Rib7 [Hypoxylon fragiforme]